MKNKVGLVIGRFQPFHKGHLYLIKKALEEVDQLIIGIGSANVNNEDNPFSHKEREKYITQALKKYKLYKKISAIIPLNDYPDDKVWLKEVEESVGAFDVAFGDNEWTNSILEEAGHKVVRVPLYKREIYEGTKIRREMKRSENPDAVLEKYLP